MSMSNKVLMKENKRLEKALGVANRTIFGQMEELKRLNLVMNNKDTINNARVSYHEYIVAKKDAIIEYLEGC